MWMTVPFGVLSLATIDNIVRAAGLTKPWWQKITTGGMLCFFILLQSVVLSRREKGGSGRMLPTWLQPKITPGDATGIVVITQIDPISVVFTTPENNLPRIAARLKAQDETGLVVASGLLGGESVVGVVIALAAVAAGLGA